MGVISAVSSSSRGSSQQSQDDADEETWARLGLAPLMATLLLPIIIGVIVLLKCVFNSCCVRRTTTKEEMYGLEGRMTMLPNADASFEISSSNHNQHLHPPQERPILSPTLSLLAVAEPQVAEKLKTAKVLINNNHPIISSVAAGDYHSAVTDPTLPQLPIPNADSDPTDTLKRATTGKRQLPDLPQIPVEQVGHPPRRSSSLLSHDGTSELYATVGEVPNPSSNRSGIINPYAHLMNRQISSSNSSVSKPSTSRGVKGEADENGGQVKSNIEPTPSSDSETYATSNHPYAKLKRNPSEHPYARVRNSSLANDEETDTDNYDLPQPYAQTRNRQAVGSVSNSQPGNQPSASSSSSANAVDGPVPPRRIGRQWRRGSHPQGQQNTDSAVHFSGDSQDSRGYTSISVREPLSNIRSQVSSTRNADSHYATVSDDSEEMYAAIDDSSEGNYMQISDGASRPSWLDAANVASPIPERREANSPLPPVPAVPPPETPGASGAIPPIPTSPLLLNQPEVIPPVYAQVTKKSKKGKAPVTPTASNASTSSQIPITEPDIIIPDPEIIIRPIPPVVSTGTTHHSHHQHHHRSKSRTLMDNSNTLEAGISEPRRWSKADISYSEFEIVREGLVPLDLKSPNMLTSSISSTTSTERQERTISPRESITSKKSLTEELVDEDNYNVIPDKHEEGRISRTNKRSSGGSKSKSRRERVDSDNYQEIEPISNTYQEIGGGLESSDHYQEIGGGSSALTNGDMDDDDGGSGLYQEIRKKEDEEEDEEDQLYEKVKPSSSKSKLAVPGRQTLERKHGYEKLKRKGSSQIKSNPSDDEDDEEDDAKHDDEDCMYESVKYPPYERLKESRSDLAVNVGVDEYDEENDFYEHIGYSGVKPKNKSKKSKNEGDPQQPEEGIDSTSDLVDVNQLYAVVDKTKKKKNTSLISNINSSSNNNNNNSMIESNLSSAFPLDHSSTGRDSTMSNRSGGRNEETIGVSRIIPELSVNTVSDLNFIDDSIDIEYI